MFWDKGYIDYSEVAAKNDSLTAVLDSVEQANLLLEGEIDSVKKKIPFKMEKIAREKYSMLKPGEQLLIIKREK
ncbi:MAG: septum formation initiator family protein [Ignavibacteriaceae bacterium]|nr:septum formation initiator family protein [Ignavibacteriaceae bacterium]